MESGSNSYKVLVVCGTRPEAIKMAPLIVLLKKTQGISVSLCVTGQHREMLDQVLALFKIVPDFDLNVMKSGQDLTDVTIAILSGLKNLFTKYKPDRVLVHGDTNTTLSASLAAFYSQIPISHVEAGLRTHNLKSPWPEEANRHITSVLADRHYAPTSLARDNLINESINPSKILVTGNTVIDGLHMTIERLETESDLLDEVKSKLPELNTRKRIILVTGHRRENFGSGFEDICKAIQRISERGDVQIIYPVHMNPNVQNPVKAYLSANSNIFLIEPLEYLPFVYLMNICHHIITDSGGVQEEAPSLGKPVLVMRDNTERPEAVDAGTVKLVGTDTDVIFSESQRLLDDSDYYQSMSSASNPYGDGNACIRICKDLIS